MYIYDNNSSKPIVADNYADTDITYPWASLLLCVSTIRLKLPDSNTSRTKRQITLFLYIGSHPRQHRSQARLRYENIAKISIILETTKYCGKFFRNRPNIPNMNLLKPRYTGRLRVSISLPDLPLDLTSDLTWDNPQGLTPAPQRILEDVTFYVRSDVRYNVRSTKEALFVTIYITMICKWHVRLLGLFNHLSKAETKKYNWYRRGNS